MTDARFAELGIASKEESLRGTRAQPLVSVIIPCLNVRDELPDCLNSLEGQTYSNLEIVVVDNGSTDGTGQYVSKHYPSAKLLRSERNLGYSGGCHYGAIVSDGEFLLFCDSDIKAKPNAVNELISAMEADGRIGVAQSKMLLARDPSRIESMGGYFTSTGILYQEDRDRLDQGFDGAPREVFGAKGAFLAIRRDVYFELGGFDVDYIAQYEDTDVCWRAWLAGQRVVVVPKSVVLHGRSITTKRLPSEFVLFHASKNRICTLIKLMPASGLYQVLPLHLLLTLGGALFLLTRFRFSDAGSLLRAIGWNLRQLPHTLGKRRKALGGVPHDSRTPLPHLRRRMPIRYLLSSGSSMLGA